MEFSKTLGDEITGDENIYSDELHAQMEEQLKNTKKELQINETRKQAVTVNLSNLEKNHKSSNGAIMVLNEKKKMETLNLKVISDQIVSEKKELTQLSSQRKALLEKEKMLMNSQKRLQNEKKKNEENEKRKSSEQELSMMKKELALEKKEILKEWKMLEDAKRKFELEKSRFSSAAAGASPSYEVGGVLETPTVTSAGPSVCNSPSATESAKESREASPAPMGRGKGYNWLAFNSGGGISSSAADQERAPSTPTGCNDTEAEEPPKGLGKSYRRVLNIVENNSDSNTVEVDYEAEEVEVDIEAEEEEVDIELEDSSVAEEAATPVKKNSKKRPAQDSPSACQHPKKKYIKTLEK
jgi:hypothetical protein